MIKIQKNDFEINNEIQLIKSKHLNDYPELLPQGRSLYETIENHIKFNGHHYIVQIKFED